ncbi:6963_t:CDS:2, partial [Entrophospora sp. SA101]
MSEDVNSFWQSINMKKQLDIKKLQCAGNALDAITNETHLRSVVMSEIISIMKHPLEHSDDVYHNEIGSNVIIPRNQVISTNKRKREDQSDYEESALLFDKSNEDTIMENIDEKTLEQEIKLPLASVNSSLKFSCKLDIVLSLFLVMIQLLIHFPPNSSAYWGVLDLTGEEKNIQQYFDTNCEKKADDIRKLN